MKLHVLLASALLATTAIAQDAQSIWPMPPTLPSPLPPGANLATHAVPRIEWLDRVKKTIMRAHQAPQDIHLIFDGDSITDFWQNAGKEVWAQRYAKLGAFDFGISADRTEHLLWRLSAGQVDGIHPKLIVILIGTNNLGECSAEQIADGIKAVVADYRKRCPEATILLQGIFPRAEKPTDAWRTKIISINHIIAKLGDGQKVIFTDFGDKFLNPDGTLSKEIMPDFLHPSAKGYQIWADAIQPYIDKYCSAQ